jgi:nucleotide-binding universal stress UspA family protein
MHVATEVFARVVGAADAATLAARVASPEGSLLVVDVERLDPLLAELERTEATLAVVGPPRHSRAAGITLGSVPTHLLHEARCSVLIARTPRDLAAWPGTIVVGIDGSPAAAAALDAASALAARYGANLRPVGRRESRWSTSTLRASSRRCWKNATSAYSTRSTFSRRRPTCSSSAAEAFAVCARSAVSASASPTRP